MKSKTKDEPIQKLRIFNSYITHSRKKETIEIQEKILKTPFDFLVVISVTRFILL